MDPNKTVPLFIPRNRYNCTTSHVKQKDRKRKWNSYIWKDEKSGTVLYGPTRSVEQFYLDRRENWNCITWTEEKIGSVLFGPTRKVEQFN